MQPVILDQNQRTFVLINAELAIASSERHRLSYTSHKIYVPFDIFDVRIILMSGSETSTKLSTYFVPTLRDHDGRVCQGGCLDHVRASQETIDINSVHGDVAAVKLISKFIQESNEATPDKDVHINIKAVGMPVGVYKHHVLSECVRNAIFKHKAELVDDFSKKLNALDSTLRKLKTSSMKNVNTPCQGVTEGE